MELLPGRPAPNEGRREHLEAALNEMERAALDFYLAAQKVGVHPFLELCGFMNEMIKIYEGMIGRDEDFFTEPLKAESHNMAYIAEKMDCIFGPALQDRRVRRAFARTLAGKGGWSVYSFLSNKKEQERRSSRSMKTAEKVEDGT